MKQDKLMDALTDIGDDLLVMARTKRFPNPWRRWGRMAACLALVICLAALALPYLPMGCGSSTSQTESAAAPETAWDAATDEEAAEVEEAPAESEPAENEAAPRPETAGDGKLICHVVVNEVYYEIDESVTLPETGPEEPVEYLGEVSQSNDESLLGCEAYAATTDAPAEIYLKTPTGWYLARTTE